MAQTIDEMRKSPDANDRLDALRYDHNAGSDIAWSRADPDAVVRAVASWCDKQAGRDTTWARKDPDEYVRWVEANWS